MSPDARGRLPHSLHSLLKRQANDPAGRTLFSFAALGAWRGALAEQLEARCKKELIKNLETHSFTILFSVGPWQPKPSSATQPHTPA